MPIGIGTGDFAMRDKIGTIGKLVAVGAGLGLKIGEILAVVRDLETAGSVHDDGRDGTAVFRRGLASGGFESVNGHGGSAVVEELHEKASVRRLVKGVRRVYIIL